ncbi:MAG: ABC transporter ATP-binding protein [Acetobacteraceae bacterium]
MSDCLLLVEGLRKSFGAVRAISDLRFEVGKGEIVGLIGPNGAGKTTVISLISGGLKPDSGTVRFDGEAVTGLAPHKLVRRGLVRTFQASIVYPERSVHDNMLQGAFATVYRGFWPAFLNAASHHRRREAAIARVDELLLELGLQDLRSVPAQQLPYGRQKMLGLAIALAAEPRLVLLDEPAAGLNAGEADAIALVIQRINRRGVSVVVIDHNMRFISSLCKRVVVLHHGTTLCVGSPEEISVHPDVVDAYLGTGNESA